VMASTSAAARTATVQRGRYRRGKDARRRGARRWRSWDGGGRSWRGVDREVGKGSGPHEEGSGREEAARWGLVGKWWVGG
jgi:hypothetical protein